LYSVVVVGPLPSTANDIEGLVETMSVVLKQQIYIFNIRKIVTILMKLELKLVI
jgi:hypothetical protein